jgi:hypothetical protein
MKSKVCGAQGGICRANTFFSTVACWFLYKANDLSAPLVLKTPLNNIWKEKMKMLSITLDFISSTIVNNELARTWKEAIALQFKTLSQLLSGDKSFITSVRTVCALTMMWSKYFSNTNQSKVTAWASLVGDTFATCRKNCEFHTIIRTSARIFPAARKNGGFLLSICPSVR